MHSEGRAPSTMRWYARSCGFVLCQTLCRLDFTEVLLSSEVGSASCKSSGCWVDSLRRDRATPGGRWSFELQVTVTQGGESKTSTEEPEKNKDKDRRTRKKTRTKTEEPEKEQGQRQKNQKKNKDKQTKSLRTMQYDAKTRRRARPEQVCELRHTRNPKPYTINQEPSLLNPETCISNLTNPMKP